MLCRSDYRKPLVHGTAVFAVMLVLLPCFAASAQDFSGVSDVSRELLIPIDPQRRERLVERYAYDLRIAEFFAKPGTLELYEFDIGALEVRGDTITISPRSIPPIEIHSDGLKLNHQYGGSTAEWTGRVAGSPHPVELTLAVRAVDASGAVRLPDPNRTVTSELLEQEHYVVLESAKRRLDERIAYGFVSNVVQVPEKRVTLRLSQLGDDLDSFESVVVYEVDNSKLLLISCGVGDQRPSREQRRRQQAYDEHVSQVRRELGLPPQ